MYCLMDGRLRHQRQIMTIDDRLVNYHEWDPDLAKDFVEFLLPMLDIDSARRFNAYECLTLSWLETGNSDVSIEF